MQGLEASLGPMADLLVPERLSPISTFSQHSLIKQNRATRATSSALHLAVKGGNVSCVKVLLDNAALVNVVDEEGMTPLHLCAMAVGNSEKHAENAKLLMAYSADTTIQNRHGQRPLQLAAGRGNDIVLQALIDAGIDVNQ